MNSRIFRLLVLSPGTILTLALASASAEVPAAMSMPPDSEIRKILVDRVGAENQGVALVVGVIDANGRRVVSYGSLARDDKRRLDGDTLFEIGSVTKVFTSLVLMDMVQKGEVAVTDPVAQYLPVRVKVPERNGKKITLQDLATQSSGLPRMPSNFKPQDASNPYADYSPDLLYEFLSNHSLTRDIGAQFEYSNLGVGLLGHALTLRAGMSYEAMVRARVLEPLGMTSTHVSLSPGMKTRLAVGHDANLQAVPNWEPGVLAGAGGLRSSANDMLTFLAANLGYATTPLAAAMTAQISIRRPAGAGGMEIAYNWFIQTKDDRSIIWHNGGTGGYRSYLGFDPKARTGVVVLCNFSSAQGQDDIGRHLLDASYPLANANAPKAHTEVPVDATSFERYVGVYQLTPTLIITMSREGEQLYTQLTGQQKFPVFPEGDGKFFLKVVDAQLTFVSDAEGKVTQVTLHQGGREQPAKRIDEAKVADVLAAATKRFKDQAQARLSEAALRREVRARLDGMANHDGVGKQDPGREFSKAVTLRSSL